MPKFTPISIHIFPEMLHEGCYWRVTEDVSTNNKNNETMEAKIKRELLKWLGYLNKIYVYCSVILQ